MVLEGKAAFITGAGRGIGRAIAISMAKNGADLTITDRNPENLAKVQEEVTATGRKCKTVQVDVLKQGQIEMAIAEAYRAYGHLDILVNCAGSIILKPFLETKIEEYRQQMDLHYMATVIAC